ncbi:MAG: FecR domain-containing protein, partial [Acidobacteriota bacterium]
ELTARAGVALEAPDPLRVADRVTTPDASVALDLLGGHRLRLRRGSELLLTAPDVVELVRGEVYVEAAPDPLRVEAAGVVVEHIGTRYAVRLRDGEGPDVRVREGRVRVEAGGAVATAGRGESIRRSVDGTLVKGPSPTHGDAWCWVPGAAPFDTDGVTLAAFLEWAAAEGGWRLEVDPALLTDADGGPADIAGSVAGLSLEAALDTVLESAGLRRELDGDRLRVLPIDARPSSP